MTAEEECWCKEQIDATPPNVKKNWLRKLIAKLLENIRPEYSEYFVKAVTSGYAGSACTPCVLSIPDKRGKMCRIDCLRRVDKTWRLDLVVAILFFAYPLESTDEERLGKFSEFCNPSLCVQPHHIQVIGKELDRYFSTFVCPSGVCACACT